MANNPPPLCAVSGLADGDMADPSHSTDDDAPLVPPPQRPDAEPSATTLLVSGFAAGVAVTGLLNPYDRALFLSVSKRRPFLHACNWRNPYQGLMQSIVSRALSTGSWFPLERLASTTLRSLPATEELPPSAQAAMAGQAAGVANALLLSPMSMVKYQTWGLPEGKRSFYATARKIQRAAGTGAFFRGLHATVCRDCVFGAAFGWMRSQLRGRLQEPTATDATGGALRFGADMVAAGSATALSSPFNFARNMQFAQPLDQPPTSTLQALRALRLEVTAQPSAAAAARFLASHLYIGWGTLRVAGGMALTAQCFELFVTNIQKM